MTTDFKSEIRDRMRSTGEKYTAARRALLEERSAPLLRRVEIHATRNGLSLDDDCKAQTVAGRQCRNGFIHGQFWPGGHHEVLLEDGPTTRMLAQRRCRVHVDHTAHVEVLLVMDDVPYKPFPGPARAPVWQDPRALAAIRAGASGAARAEALSLYLTLCETAGSDAPSDVGEHAGLAPAQVETAMGLLASLDLVRDGTLIA